MFKLVLFGLIAATAVPAAAQQAVTRADFMKGVDANFAAVDTTHRGYVTKEELAADQQRSLARAKASVEQTMRAKFNQLDTNKDGKLSFEEFMAMAPSVSATETPDQLMARIDTNHDGKITLQEFRAAQIAKFNRIDTNHDGVLSPQEQQSAAFKK